MSGHAYLSNKQVTLVRKYIGLKNNHSDELNTQFEESFSELLKILGPTRKEKGCLQYELHQDIEDPSIFMFYEIWETTDLWKAHDTKAHIVAFKENIEGSVKNISFNKLTVL